MRMLATILARQMADCDYSYSWSKTSVGLGRTIIETYELNSKENDMTPLHLQGSILYITISLYVCVAVNSTYFAMHLSMWFTQKNKYRAKT